MEWWLVLILIFGGVLGLLTLGMPVAFAFMAVTIVGIIGFQGWGGPLQQYVLSIYSSVSVFTLLPVPLFILMSEVLWNSSIAVNALEALDRFFGRVPGRLSLLTVASGTMFSALSGSTMATTAMLGRLLLPNMRKRGYAPDLSMGTIMASGGLDMLIPPSALAVVFASVAQVSIGKLLLALIPPGLLLAALYAGYIIVRAKLDPNAAPEATFERAPLRDKIVGMMLHLMPLLIVIFFVIGTIFFGIATPTEAAALGCLASIILAATLGGMDWRGFMRAIDGTMRVSVMMLTILAAAIGFSQILAFTGASRGLLQYVVGEVTSPILMLILMNLLLLVLGCFMEQIAIMMITLPIFMPIVKALGIDPIWFAVLMLMNLQIALMTPPFGLLLFVMKGVAPPDVQMHTIYRAAVPFIVMDIIVIGVVIVWPDIALFLPRLAF